MSFPICISEIVKKENERYRLVQFGLIQSTEKVISTLCNKYSLQNDWNKTPFSDFRSLVLNCLYSELISKSLTENNAVYSKWMLIMCKDVLRRIKNNLKIPASLDSELNPSPETLSFNASTLYLNSILTDDILNPPTFELPEYLEHKIVKLCDSNYPIEIKNLLSLLKRKDVDLWNTMHIVIYKISGWVASQYLYNPKNEGDFRTETWLKAKDKVSELVLDNKTPEFESGIHLRNYIGRVCYNNLLNVQKKEQVYEKRITDWNENEMESYIDECTDKDIALSDLKDIDPEDSVTVKTSLVKILYNKPTELFNILADGIEDRLEILMTHSDGKSYRDIVIEKYGSHIPEKEMKQHEDRMRQGVLRGKKILIARFYDLLKKIGDYE